MKVQMDISIGKELLFLALLDEIIETLKCQLGEMKIFTPAIEMMPATDDEVLQVNPKMNYAPLTNLGSENEFAMFDNHLKVSRGTSSVTALLRKNLVARNAYLVD